MNDSPDSSAPAKRLSIRHLFVLGMVYILIVLALHLYTLTQTTIRFAQAAGIRLSDFNAPFETVASQDGVIRILLLGIGGGEHEAPNLTDTIMIVEYSIPTHTLRVISLPRDLWLPGVQDKINTVYVYALKHAPPDPFAYVKRVYHDELGIEADYVAIVRFETFVRVIDAVGGIQVNVPYTLVDPQYPIAGLERKECVPYDPNYRCRYETLTIPAGLQFFNGKTALKYVRSRHATGKEGNDFARAKRQQIVIDAFQDKFMELLRKGDTQSILAMIRIAHADIVRDVPNSVILAVARRSFKLRSLPTFSMRTLSEDLFVTPPYKQYGGRYVLVPKEGTLPELIRKTLH
jgi:LCP family protein required for cell wall assembly